MSNLSRMRARSRRSARQAAYNLRRYNNGAQRSNKPVVTEPIDPYETIIKDQDTMLLFNDIDDIIPSYYRWSSHEVRNDVFMGYNQKIKCEMIGLVYSPKKKLFYMMAINNDYTSYILFEAVKLKHLPVDKLYSDPLITDKYKMIEKSNRMIIGVLRYDPIWNLCLNPIMSYKPTELFRK